MNDFAVFSNGTKIKNPKNYRNLEKKLAKEQKKLSRRRQLANKKGLNLKDCKNYQKQKIKVAIIHEKMANKRKDFIQKLSTDIVKNHDIICIESLNVLGMLKNKKLAKSISDVSWSEFVRCLFYKCEWYGKTILSVDRWYPSSKTCHLCGFVKKDLTLEDRIWVCPNCNEIHDRDINAAKNILKEAKRQIV